MRQAFGPIVAYLYLIGNAGATGSVDLLGGKPGETIGAVS
jgi:hypothetical protein